MAKTSHVEVTKLYHGFVSVRDYMIDKAVSRGADILIHYKEKTMRVPLDRLKSKWQMHGLKFKSRFGTGEYMLYDFKFEADDAPKEEDNQPTLL